MFKIIIALISGILFGCGMIISQMVDPQKVIGFLDIVGNWDPSLALVMGGALTVFAPFYHLLIKKRSYALNKQKFSWTSNTKVDAKLIYGAVIFGSGWGLAGICPGPAITSLSGGSLTMITFVLSMIIGMTLANHYTKTILIIKNIKKSCAV